MTERLFDKDSYIKEFLAKVVAIQKVDDNYLVELDKTAFFPEGGGQFGDQGFIGESRVIDTQIKNGIIYHTLTTNELKVGEVYPCKIDWDIRFMRMQEHSGEHILSGLIHNKYGLNNVGFHLGNDFTTFDIDGKFSDESVKEIETLANTIVYENHKINILYPTKEEIKSIDYRSKIDYIDGIRIVEIEGCDFCACCAPHVKTTSEIGLIKIIDFCAYKGGTRFTIKCGKRALKDYQMLSDNVSIITKSLSCKRDEFSSKVELLQQDLLNKNYQIKMLNSEIAKLKIKFENVNGINICVTENVDYDSMRNIMNDNTTKNGVYMIFSKCDNEFLYTIASSDMSVTDYVKGVNESLDGKGGGKPNYAQGRLTATKEQIIAYFNNL